MIDIGEKNLYLNDAQFYDLDTREVTKVDIPFYRDLVSDREGDILELACGTGRITIPLAKAGHKIWGIEYSESMMKQFNIKMEQLPRAVVERIHLLHGDMSHFSLSRKFQSILLPCRSFQLLLEEELEIACLKCIHNHLEDNGVFVIDVANFGKNVANGWVSETEYFDWENIDPKTGNKINRTHIRKEIDLEKQIIFPLKIYRITYPDGSTNTITKRSPWKYFFVDQIRNLLTANKFEIIKEMGDYEGNPISKESPEFIFICQKKSEA